jgi:two-component system, cell cycle sensor histidine kinase and response regulator CckA
MADNETVERLAAGIAHDFNALLTAIVHHADRLSADLSPSDPRALDVIAIRQAADQAAALTDDLLAFTKSQTLRPTVVDVNATVERVRFSLQRVVGARVAIGLRLAADLRTVRVDVEQLERLLHRLAGSARDAMADGGALIIATANRRLSPSYARARRIAPGDYVELTVTDTGHAIESASQPHLFEPFFEVPQRPRGRGLGLAIVHGVVAQSGGHIAVESPITDAGRGSRFTVCLPATQESATERPLARRTKDSGSEIVLIAATDEPVQALIAEILRRRGYRVLMASDAPQGVRIARELDAPIDLLITTADGNGALVAAAVRHRRSSAPILYVAASEGIVDQDASGVLTQPFAPDALARKVREILGQERREGQEEQKGQENASRRAYASRDADPDEADPGPARMPGARRGPGAPRRRDHRGRAKRRR